MSFVTRPEVLKEKIAKKSRGETVRKQKQFSYCIKNSFKNYNENTLSLALETISAIKKKRKGSGIALRNNETKDIINVIRSL